MAITQTFNNFDTYYRITSGDKIIVNDLSEFDIMQSDIIKQSTMTTYGNSEIIDSRPTCDCGKSAGGYRLGKICRHCNTEVKEITQKMDPVLWLRAMRLSDGREIRFLNTTFWIMLSDTIDSKKDWLRYFTDSKYNPNIPIPPHIAAIRDFLGTRSYSHVMNNIVSMLEFMTNLSKYKVKDKLDKIRAMIELYQKSKDDLFTTYIPVVNKKLFVMENTSKGRFVNLIVADLIDVSIKWNKAASNEDNISDIKKENTTAAVLSTMAKVYKHYYTKYVGKKTGILRKIVYGSRGHFTFRSVIVSIPGPHDHDEIIIPWSIAVTNLRPFILNKLERRGFAYEESSTILDRAIISYSELIDDILQEIIREAGPKGLSFVAQRNMKRVPVYSNICEKICG